MNTNTPINATVFNTEGITYLVTSASTVKVISHKNKFDAISITIPKTVLYNNINYNVTAIGAFAFINYYDLMNLSIPDSIVVIEEKAFANNYNLAQVVCNSKSPIVISENVFENVPLNSCKLIVPTKNISIYKASKTWAKFNHITDIFPFTLAGISYEITSPSTVKVIRSNTYFGSITIPEIVEYKQKSYNVTQISETAFQYNRDITTLNIGNNITTIEDSTFTNCSNLVSVTLPDSISSIGEFAFNDCESLTSINIPNSITFIKESVFDGCSNLSTIVIPNSVISIDESAFAWCPKLTSIICSIQSPLTLPSNVFAGNTNLDACTLHVPTNSLEAYKEAYIWQGFGSIIANSSNFITTDKTPIDSNLAQNNLSIDLNDSTEATLELFTENG
ncbi:hypothetical protein FHR24_002009 [Wenyingzhuangia heitensis]|uniref:Leucine rich repeat-containing protein n=1 Tax=Wenyingzhuangia heitensis TaxID=1487859 RepID=A0ABX0UEB9_9FLAO|nr:leucine-rich repeat domain-containing protein [Wenyingzhuangia heitensis]NIJ45541.1 hypothetical protein [Wenyingzhuangia heitensis]